MDISEYSDVISVLDGGRPVNLGIVPRANWAAGRRSTSGSLVAKKLFNIRKELLK